MKTRREWIYEALSAAAMAQELEQRPGVLAPISDAVRDLELALAIDSGLERGEPEPGPKPHHRD